MQRKERKDAVRTANNEAYEVDEVSSRVDSHYHSNTILCPRKRDDIFYNIFYNTLAILMQFDR